jgi:proline dehydrogenase
VNIVQPGDGIMNDRKIREAIIAFLEDALKLAEEIEDGATAYLIERALDEI